MSATRVADGSHAVHRNDSRISVPVIIGGLEQMGEADAFEIRNPADPSEVVTTGLAASADQIDAGLKAAQDASRRWSRVPAPQRGAILNKAAAIMTERADELARLVTREEGKTLADSAIEVGRAIDTLHFYAAIGRLLGGETHPSSQMNQFVFTKREPIGVVALVTPWNFPVAIPIQKLAPAIVAGNAVVLKPSSYTPGVAYTVCRILVDAGLPEGVVTLLVGPGSTLGPAIMSNAAVGALSFTGSQAAGFGLAQGLAGNSVRVQLELGGKNPLVVLADANLDTALDVAARGTFGLTGQSCTATGRIIVERPLYDAFVDGLAKRAAQLVTGNGLDPGVQLGPKVSATELEAALSRVESGTKNGDASLVLGGSAARNDGAGYFMAPTVLSDVDPQSELGSTELFSPVACVMPVGSFEEAIALANATTFGLAAAVCTRSLHLAHEFVERIEAGVVKVNASTTGLELHVPFGGFKGSSSGTGKELGLESLSFFTRLKSVYLTYEL